MLRMINFTYKANLKAALEPISKTKLLLSLFLN